MVGPPLAGLMVTFKGENPVMKSQPFPQGGHFPGPNHGSLPERWSAPHCRGGLSHNMDCEQHA